MTKKQDETERQYSVAFLLLALLQDASLEFKAQEVFHLAYGTNIPEVPRKSFFKVLPYINLIESLKSIEEGQEVPWIPLLSNLLSFPKDKSDILSPLPEPKSMPSQIKLIKLLEWFQENPDSLPKEGICLAVLAKLAELKIFKPGQSRLASIFLEFLLAFQGLSPTGMNKIQWNDCIKPLLSDPQNPKSLESSLEKLGDARKENVSKAKECFAPKVQNLENHYQKARDSLFYKDNPKALSLDPDFFKLQVFYEQAFTQIKLHLQNLGKDLSELDRDLEYFQVEKKLLGNVLEKSFQKVRTAAHVLSNIQQIPKKGFEYTLELRAPIGTVWRSKIPKNSFSSLTFLFPTGVAQIYTIDLEKNESGQGAIMPTRSQDFKVLDAVFFQGSGSIPDPKKLQSQAQTSFFQFLSIVEEEVMRARKALKNSGS